MRLPDKTLNLPVLPEYSSVVIWLTSFPQDGMPLGHPRLIVSFPSGTGIGGAEGIRLSDTFATAVPHGCAL